MKNRIVSMSGPFRIDITAPYGWLDSWGYDRFVAPALDDPNSDIAKEVARTVRNGGRILDVGCGGGQLALHIAQLRPDISVFGMDLAPEQIARAKKRAASVSADCVFLQGSSESLPFPDGYFDMVLSVGSVKHWSDQSRGVAEMYRVVRSTGQLCIAELDRARAEDEDCIGQMVAKSAIPRFARRFAIRFFTRYINQSVSMSDIKSILSAYPFVSHEFESIRSIPAFLFRGTKLADASQRTRSANSAISYSCDV